MAALCENMTKTLNRSNTKIICVSHHHLSLQKKERSSPMMPNRLIKLSINRMRVPSLR